MDEKKKIIIVDDDDSIRMTLQEIFKTYLQSVASFESASGKQALSILRQCKPDLMLLDVKMEEMNGLAVLQIIKQSGEEQLEAIPIVMLSVIGNRDIIHKAKKLGAVDYITKPFDNKVLIAKVKKYLKITKI